MQKKLLSNSDTIVAIATPRGVGGVGIVRVSGVLVKDIAKKILGKLPSPRKAECFNFLGENNTVIDFGIALFFKGPNSFTGDDVLEFQGHGGSYVLDLVVKRIISLGARLAEPGEFSKRAFLNGKLDLNQAEAVCDLIHAQSERGALAAIRTLKGDFSKKINELSKEIKKLRVFVEAAFDFADEEIDFIKEENVVVSIDSLVKKCEEILKTAKNGVKLVDGVKASIIGEPNVGKSSLLNALSNEEVAIVTNTPGTTRDVLRSNIKINDIVLNLSDTAGIRQSDCLIEKEGIKRALKETNDAELIIVVVDGEKATITDPFKLFPNVFKNVTSTTKIIVVVNKIDKTSEKPNIELVFESTSTTFKNQDKFDGCLKKIKDLKNKKLLYSKVFLSAKTKAGLCLFKDHILELLGVAPGFEEGCFTARRRHVESIKACKKHLLLACEALKNDYTSELVAEDLKLAHNELSLITGEVSSDDLLGEIFNEFCIGK